MPKRVLQQFRVCFVISVKAPILVPRTWSAHFVCLRSRAEADVYRLNFSRRLCVLHSLHVSMILLSRSSRHCTPILRSSSLFCYPIRPLSSRLSPKRSLRSPSKHHVLSCAYICPSSLYTYYLQFHKMSSRKPFRTHFFPSCCSQNQNSALRKRYGKS